MALALSRFSMSYKVGVLHNHWSGLSSANLSTRINRDNYSVLLAGADTAQCCSPVPFDA
jgi:hypothetical protein